MEISHLSKTCHLNSLMANQDFLRINQDHLFILLNSLKVSMDFLRIKVLLQGILSNLLKVTRNNLLMVNPNNILKATLVSSLQDILLSSLMDMHRIKGFLQFQEVFSNSTMLLQDSRVTILLGHKLQDQYTILLDINHRE